MTTPVAYRWSCLGCEGGNEATATVCSSCGLASRTTGAEIAKRRGELAIERIASRETLSQLDPPSPPNRPWSGGSWALLFPEIIPAACFAVFAPVWLAILLADQRFSAAGTLGAGMAMSYALGGYAVRARSKGWLTIAVWVCLLTAFSTMGAR